MALSMRAPSQAHFSALRIVATPGMSSGRIFVAIEAGALVRSLDGGETWEDRKPSGPFDTHTLVMHRLAPDRLYSAAGDGFMESGNGFVRSDDGGETWYRPDEGLEYHYLWSVAANPVDPDTIVISASPGPRQAHSQPYAESAIYRRSDGNQWRQVQAGLPAPRGLLAPVLAADEAEPGVFYAGSNQGIFRSGDTGITWEKLSIPWPSGMQLGRANALVVVQE